MVSLYKLVIHVDDVYYGTDNIECLLCVGNSMIDLNDREQSNESPQDKSKQSMLMEYREGTANITDYSPEWAYPEVCLYDLIL